MHQEAESSEAPQLLDSSTSCAATFAHIGAHFMSARNNQPDWLPAEAQTQKGSVMTSIVTLLRRLNSLFCLFKFRF